jgi:hypothetical protein
MRTSGFTKVELHIDIEIVVRNLTRGQLTDCNGYRLVPQLKDYFGLAPPLLLEAKIIGLHF